MKRKADFWFMVRSGPLKFAEEKDSIQSFTFGSGKIRLRYKYSCSWLEWYFVDQQQENESSWISTISTAGEIIWQLDAASTKATDLLKTSSSGFTIPSFSRRRKFVLVGRYLYSYKYQALVCSSKGSSCEKEY